MPERTHKAATRKIRLTEPEDAAIRAAAEARGMGASEYMRRAVATQVARDRLETVRREELTTLDREHVAFLRRCVNVQAAIHEAEAKVKEAEG